MTPTAQCALHPELAATSVCPRCGAFTCSTCNPDGRSLCPSCLKVTGDAGVRAPTPWERRAELGLVQAVWQTWRATMLEPAKFWQQLDPQGAPMDAFLYGWLVSSVAGILQIPFLLLNLAQTQAQLREAMSAMKDLPGPMKDAVQLFFGNTPVLALVLGLSTIVIFPLSVIISSAFTHLGVRLMGATQQPFSATLRVICYAIAPNVLSGIPVVGGLAGLYTLVLEIWGIKDVHGLSPARAAVAVLWPVLFLCCCGAFGAVIVAASIGSRL